MSSRRVSFDHIAPKRTNQATLVLTPEYALFHEGHLSGVSLNRRSKVSINPAMAGNFRLRTRNAILKLGFLSMDISITDVERAVVESWVAETPPSPEA